VARASLLPAGPTVLAAGLLAVLASATPPPAALLRDPRPVATGPLGSRSSQRADLPPSFLRPALVGGRAFPVARSTYLSLLEFEDDWHAPRMRLVGGRWRLVGRHEGIDISAERGTPVLSMTGGVVEATGWTFYSGLRVGVRGTDGKYYLYAHLDALAPGVVPGAAVRAGQVLGSVGNTGYGGPGHRDEFPPHLHFGILGPAGWEDPYPLLRDLYRATVRAHRRAEARLAALRWAGDHLAWLRLARRLLLERAGQDR
jgi:murein DD-endopeptidase MepM/ murein hydrolase activator NlpD